MSGRRSTTPLFELLSEERAERAVASTPSTRPDTTRSGADSVDLPPSESTRITGLRISTRLLFLVIAANLLLVAGVWVGGFMTGKAKADAEWRKAGIDPGSPNKPVLGIHDPTLGTRGTTAPASQGSTAAQTNRPASQTPATTPSPTEDPRTPGWNYLHLVTLDREEAERVVAFLLEQRIPALAVPVEGSSSRANNEGPRRVFTLLGVPGGSEYSLPKNQRLREQHEAEMRRIGRLWQIERGGTANFDQPIWTKYQPGA